MATTKPIYTVLVRDIYCGQKGYPVEECETVNELEADTWYKQWKEEYSAANGYEGFKVSKTIKQGENHASNCGM